MGGGEGDEGGIRMNHGAVFVHGESFTLSQHSSLAKLLLKRKSKKTRKK